MDERPLKFAYNVEDMIELLKLADSDKSFGVGMSSELMLDICERIINLESHRE
jgi:hypothetical protein